MAADLITPLAEIVAELEKTVPYASVLYKKKSGTRVNASRLQESVEPEDPSEGLVFTLWNGQTFFEHATNKWEWPTLKTDLKDLAVQAMRQRDPKKPSTDIDPGPKIKKDFSTPVKTNPASISPKEKLAWAKDRMNAVMKKDPLVVNVMSLCGDVTSEDIFINRHKMLRQNITRVDSILVVFLSDGNNTVDLHTGLSKNGSYEAVSLPDHELDQIIVDGKALLKAARLKPGTYDVVTDPEWSGIIAHECFGHGMETDLYVRQRALSQHYIGKRVASDIVNMFDDASITTEAGGFFFDDEGQVSTPTHIIKNGMLQRGLTDLPSAHKLKLERSANGRRESFARKAYARMTNTFFDNGKNTKDEMIASIKNGVYLRHATNGMEDPQAWGIQVEGLWAEEIKDGKLTGKVFSPVIMTGFVPDLLKSISMVGNDRSISGLGMCGKGHKEWVKNTTGGPHLKMKARLA